MIQGVDTTFLTFPFDSEQGNYLATCLAATHEKILMGTPVEDDEDEGYMLNEDDDSYDEYPEPWEYDTSDPYDMEYNVF